MTGTLLLALALTQGVPAPPRGLQITTVTRFANGSEKIGGMFFVPQPYGPTGSIYYVAKPTVCDGYASSEAPAGPEFGWQIELVSPEGAAPVFRWSRLAGAAKAVAPMSGAKAMPAQLPDFQNIELDSLDQNLPGGTGCGAVSYSLVARYAPEFRPAMPQSSAPPPSTIVRFVARIAYPDGRTEDRTVKTLPVDGTRAQSFYVSVPASVCDGLTASDKTPAAGVKGWLVGVGPVKYAPGARARVRADVVITAQDAANLPDAKVVALPTQTTQRAADIVSVTGLRPVNGCNAVAVTLQGRLLPDPVMEVAAETRPTYKLMEAEFWFVHKAPDGKETTQRQTVRMRNGGRADFYFDDMTLNANVADRTEPVTVEVFGTLDTGTVMSGNEVNISLKLTRRYINPKATALGIPPTVGKTDYPTTIDVGEVVSFLLPPLENDKGAFLGHRFSVRLRIKPVE